jgi:hypothetical protein
LFPVVTQADWHAESEHSQFEVHARRAEQFELTPPVCDAQLLFVQATQVALLGPDAGGFLHDAALALLFDDEQARTVASAVARKPPSTRCFTFFDIGWVLR